MGKICGIYKIISPKGKIYIGESVDIVLRFKTYSNLQCRKQIKLYNSLSKYGYEMHSFEIIEECEFKDLYCRERYWQDYYDVLSENGLNLKLTPHNEIKGVFSKETRSKMSKSLKGKIGMFGISNPMYGKCGKLHPTYKTPRTKEVRDKISKTKLNQPNKAFENGISDEFRNNMSIIKLGNKSRPKLVLDVEMGVYYDSAKEASKIYNINYNTLVNYLQGKYKNKSNLRYV